MLIGLVGKPNVGKSTFFKASTLAEVEIGDYPFVTIKANRGVGYVSIDCIDKEFNTQCNPRVGFCLEHTRFIPVELIDVAGLVPGAFEGKGMGNQFLDDLRQADILVHIIDISGSTNEKGEKVDPGTYDPAKDIRFLENELDMWYLGIFNKVWEKFSRETVQTHQQTIKALAKQFSGLGVDEDAVKKIITQLSLEGKKLTDWDQGTLKIFVAKLRRLTKPMIIAANKIDTKTGQENYNRIKKEFSDYTIMPCSAETELALREASKKGLIDYVPGSHDFKIHNVSSLSEKQKAGLEFIRENVLRKSGSTGVQQILNFAVFDMLGYIAVYPAGVNNLSDRNGNVLPDCFLMPRNSTVLDFAYKIHSDIGDHFIRAIDVKTKRIVGKEHLLKHRDAFEIVTSK